MKRPSDKLFRLLRSMKKAEKRYFKLWISRYKGNQSRRSIELFDAINKQPIYDEELLLKILKTNALKKNLSIHKNLLFNSILEALRNQHLEKYDKIKLHEKLDYVIVLHDKNLLDIAIEMVDDVIANCQEKNYSEIEQEALLLKVELLRFNDGDRKKMQEPKQVILDQASTVSKDIDTKIKLLKLQNKMNGFYNVSYQIATQREGVSKIQAFGEKLIYQSKKKQHKSNLMLDFELIDWFHYIKAYDLEEKELDRVEAYFQQQPLRSQALLTNYYAYLQRRICFFYQKKDYKALINLKKIFKHFEEENDLSIFLQTMVKISCIQVERELVLGGYNTATDLEEMRADWFAQTGYSSAQRLDVLRIFMSYYLIVGDYDMVLDLYYNVDKKVVEEGAFYTGIVCKYIVMVAQFELENINGLEYWVRHIKYVLTKEKQYGVIAQLILNFFQKGVKPLVKDYIKFRAKFLELMEEQDGCISDLFLIWVTAKAKQKNMIDFYRQGAVGM